MSFMLINLKKKNYVLMFKVLKSIYIFESTNRYNRCKFFTVHWSGSTNIFYFACPSNFR